MNASVSISFSKLTNLSQEQAYSLVPLLAEFSFDEAKGFGFQNIRIVESIVSGVLVKRLPTFVQQFDPVSRSLREREIFVYSDIEFFLDLSNLTLDVFGTISNASKVRSSLRSLLSKQTTIAAVPLLPSIVIPKFNRKGVKVNVESLTVNNFRHKEGIIGRYSMHVSYSNLADEIIDEYESDVVQAHIHVVRPTGTEFAATFSQSGQMRLTGHDDEIADHLVFCKSVLFDAKGE